MNPALRTAEGHYTLAALDAFAWMLTPVWVFDLTVPTILWANAAALELWEARDLAELQARDFSDLTDTTRQRLARALAEIRDGRTCAEQWTFYPKGRPVHLIVNLTGIVLSDGRLTTLHEARPVVPEQPDPLALRGILDAVNVGGECGIEEGLQYETAQFGLMFSTDDMREGTQAFLERRKPAFTGR